MRDEIKDELKPIEVIAPGDRYARIVGMLLGNKIKVSGWTPGGAVYVLDGKAYHVNANNIKVWDYFVFSKAWREKQIEGFEAA